MIISFAGLAGMAAGAWWCARPSFLSTKKHDPAGDYIDWQNRQRQPHAPPDGWRFDGFGEEDERGNQHGEFTCDGYISNVIKKYHKGLYLHFHFSENSFSGEVKSFHETPAGGMGSTVGNASKSGHFRLMHLVALSDEEEAEWLSSDDHQRLDEAAATGRKVRISGLVWKNNGFNEGGFSGFDQTIHCPCVRNLKVEFLD
jgi:hypothetical protein